jgi:hypothetical protein
VLAIVSAFRLPPLETVDSLLQQKHIVPKIVVVAAFPSALKGLSPNVMGILHPPDKLLWTGMRVAKALNSVLANLDLKRFDYILKVDDDVIFPPTFLSENIESQYDLMGRGCGLLIKVKPFIELMGGRFMAICSDDTYLVTCFSINNMKVLPWKWKCGAVIKKQPNYNWSRMFEIGKDHYRMGFLAVTFVLSILSAIKERGLLYIFIILGYFFAFLKHETRYPIASDVIRNEKQLFSMGFRNVINKSFGLRSK